MNKLVNFLLAVILFAALGYADATLQNKNVERTIDLTNHLAQITNVITVENLGTSGQASYTFMVEPLLAKNVAFIGAQTIGSKTDDLKLEVTQMSDDTVKGSSYKVAFKSALAPGKTLTFEVELVLIDQLRPYPVEISQMEKQYVLFKGNHVYYSAYPTQKQATIVNLATNKVESYSQRKPTTLNDATINYGPYENIKAYEQDEMSIHYENNTPFLTITNLVRTIEVSHWGNIAVEETIDIAHTGAKLKGPFSRFEYMRKQGGYSSVKSIKTLLPHSAKDVYYRDEIGNISTSNLRVPRQSKSMLAEPVELELRPRFPLFGGWKTHYIVGYNVPAYHYLFNKGNDYLLKMKIIDHIYDDQIIETATIKFILPEFITDIKLIAPFQVDRQPDQLHYTYLDTVGRPVIVINKKNMVDNHCQDIQIQYKFSKLMILQEPFLVVGFLFFLFLIMIVIVRLDFSIIDKPTEHSKKE